MATSSFRLLTEPALLKLGRHRRDDGRGDRFRLLTEPASLKQPAVRVQRHHGTGFRLLTEPASLKRSIAIAIPVHTKRFPAPHRAGLIEARQH